MLFDHNLPRLCLFPLWELDLQYAFVIGSRDLARIDIVWKHERTGKTSPPNFSTEVGTVRPSDVIFSLAFHSQYPVFKDDFDISTVYTRQCSLNPESMVVFIGVASRTPDCGAIDDAKRVTQELIDIKMRNGT